MTETKQVIHPRVSQSTYDAVTSFAETSNRTLSGAVEQLLTEALAARAPMVSTPAPEAVAK